MPSAPIAPVSGPASVEMKTRVCISIVAFIAVFLKVWTFSASDMILDGGPIASLYVD